MAGTDWARYLQYFYLIWKWQLTFIYLLKRSRHCCRHYLCLIISHCTLCLCKKRNGSISYIMRQVIRGRAESGKVERKTCNRLVPLLWEIHSERMRKKNTYTVNTHGEEARKCLKQALGLLSFCVQSIMQELIQSMARKTLLGEMQSMKDP